MTDYLGTVVAVQANFYRVSLSLAQGGQSLLCTRRSRLKKIGQKVMVGDRVLVEEVDLIDAQGVVAKVFPRKTVLDRPPIANADQIVLVFALADPPLDPFSLSQFLVKAESTQLFPLLCLNKIDLVSEQEQEQWQQRLLGWGYKPIFISVAKVNGLDVIQTYLDQKISVFAGLSGAGKSSLINTLIPQTNIATAAVSGKLNRGRHTTRHVELFDLPLGGLVADTPGFNQPDLDCNPQDLASYFPEARERLAKGSCQFSDCLHRDEPNCLVRGDWERYDHYLRFLEKVIAHQEAVNKMPDDETNLKLKMDTSGKENYEPKLESKKYRRLSRRASHQELQDFYESEVEKL